MFTQKKSDKPHMKPLLMSRINAVQIFVFLFGYKGLPRQTIQCLHKMLKEVPDMKALLRVGHTPLSNTPKKPWFHRGFPMSSTWEPFFL